MRGFDMGVKELVLGEGDLGRLRECLLIGYELDLRRHEFVIVCDYWERQAPGQRTFLKLVFGGIEEFERELGVRRVRERAGGEPCVADVRE
jgi:hypothetical protein